MASIFPMTSLMKWTQNNELLTLDEELLGLRLTAGVVDWVADPVWWFFSTAAPITGDGVAAVTAACACWVTWSAGNDSGTVCSVGLTIGLPEVVDIANYSLNFGLNFFLISNLKWKLMLIINFIIGGLMRGSIIKKFWITTLAAVRLELHKITSTWSHEEC